jgi:hypothetical protein
MTAKIKLEDVVVIATAASGKAFQIAENIELADGRSFPRKWWVITSSAGYQENDVVTVVGDFGCKVEEYQGPLEAMQGKWNANLSVWNPVVTRSGATVDAPVTSGDAPF